MNSKETGWEGWGWINVAQNRDHWQAVVDMIMKFYIYDHENLK
jgi:hypothetical protein